MNHPTNITVNKDSDGNATYLEINVYCDFKGKYFTFTSTVPEDTIDPNRNVARKIVNAATRFAEKVDPANDEPYIVAKKAVNDLVPESQHYAEVIQFYRTASNRAERYNQAMLGSLAGELPGFGMKTTHPITGTEVFLGPTVVGLNDRYGWSRDQIADWLDSLHESGTLDLSFKDRPEETSIEDK